jgi:hypothetical protein
MQIHAFGRNFSIRACAGLLHARFITHLPFLEARLGRNVTQQPHCIENLLCRTLPKRVVAGNLGLGLGRKGTCDFSLRGMSRVLEFY